MAKVPYPTRLEPELLEAIKYQAKIQKRSVNSMIEILCEYGLKYLSEAKIEPLPILRGSNVEKKAVNQ